MRLVLPVLLTGILLASTAHAEIYRYLDQDGNEAYTNDFAQLPKKWQDHYEKLGKKPAPGSERAPQKTAQPKSDSSRLEHIKERLKAGRTKRMSQDEANRYWQRTMWHAQAQLSRKQAEREAKKKRANEITWLSPRRYRSSRLSAEDQHARSRHLRDVERLDKEITQLQHQINVLIPNLARRDGVPPGLLRQPPPKNNARR